MYVAVSWWRECQYIPFPLCFYANNTVFTNLLSFLTLKIKLVSLQHLSLSVKHFFNGPFWSINCALDNGPRKFCSAVSEKLRQQTVLSNIFHFGQISKFKKGVTPRKKIESKFPVDMHNYTLCPSFLRSFTKFCYTVSEELCWHYTLRNLLRGV